MMEILSYAEITSQIYNTKFVLIVDDWKESGLKLPSVIRVHKIATLEKNMVEIIMGRVNDPIKTKVKQIIFKLIE